MTEDKAKTSPVYMNSKVTKQLESADTSHLGWGTPQANPLFPILPLRSRGVPTTPPNGKTAPPPP